jgi:DNA replication protein DnaC
VRNFKNMKNKKCNHCSDRGYIKNKNTKSFVLCECIKKQCECKGNNSFFLTNNETGELSRCPCFDYRYKLNVLRKIFKNSQFPAKYSFKFLEDFQIKDSNNNFMKDFVGLQSFIMKYIDDFKLGETKKGFLLWSETKGNGKTFSASIVLNELMFNYMLQGRYLKLSSSYFGMLKKSYSEKNLKGYEQDIIKKYIDYDLLLIDDFGTQRGTDWEIEKLYELIDGRCENEKLTFITTNNDINNIDTLVKTDRIYSRIAEMCKIVHIQAPCYRLFYLDKNEV